MICWCVKFGKLTFLTHIRAIVDGMLNKSIGLDMFRYVGITVLVARDIFFKMSQRCPMATTIIVLPLQHSKFVNVWFINVYLNVG